MTNYTVVLLHLQAMRDLLAAGWIQGNYAMTEGGFSCNPSSAHACKFCMEGARQRVESQLTLVADRSTPLRRIIEGVIGNTSLAMWNDKKERTHEEVLIAMDKAIEACQGLIA